MRTSSRDDVVQDVVGFLLPDLQVMCPACKDLGANLSGAGARMRRKMLRENSRATAYRIGPHPYDIGPLMAVGYCWLPQKEEVNVAREAAFSFGVVGFDQNTMFCQFH